MLLFYKKHQNLSVFYNKFDLNLQVSEDKHQVVAKLKEQVKSADYVYLFTDPDREGSVIAWSLIKFLKIIFSIIKYQNLFF